MDEVFYPPRAEATVIDPAEIEKMLAAATPRCLPPIPRQFIRDVSQPHPDMRPAAAEEWRRLFDQHFPWLSQLDQKAAEPDQRGFIIGSERL